MLAGSSCKKLHSHWLPGLPASQRKVSDQLRNLSYFRRSCCTVGKPFRIRGIPREKHGKIRICKIMKSGHSSRVRITQKYLNAYVFIFNSLGYIDSSYSFSTSLHIWLLGSTVKATGWIWGAAPKCWETLDVLKQCLNISFNINFPSTLRSSKFFPAFRVPHQNSLCISLFPHMCYMPYASHPHNIWWGIQITKLLIM